MRLTRTAVLSLAALATLSQLAQAADSNNARSLFVEQAKKPTKPINMGVSYWLELERDGKKQRVSNKHKFLNGDQLRIHVKPNADSYAYIVMMQGSKGDKAVLFPTADKEDNKIKANKEVVLPTEDKYMKFDNTPGLETLRVIVSRSKIDPEKQLQDKPKESVKITHEEDTKSDKVPDGTVVCIVMNGAKFNGARNLTVETDKKEAENETLVVNKDPNKALTIDIALNHAKSEKKTAKKEKPKAEAKEDSDD